MPKAQPALSPDDFISRVRMSDLSEKEVDELPFGAIELDAQGKILRFNRYESSLSGVQRNNAVGKQFFTEVAPCTNVKAFYGRFKEGVANKKMHEKFRFHFAFKQNPRDVTVTLMYSESTKSVWVFVRPA